MKKSLLIATGLVLLSTSAFATKTRMTSLGQDTARGSHYIDDTRNVFMNPAHAGSTTNYVVTEWGTGGAGSNAAAEGGFFKEAGSFNYGVYLNDQSDSQNNIADATNSGYAGVAGFGNAGVVDRSDNLDLFFAGDMGFQWGARVGLTSSSNKSATASTQEQKHSGMSLGVGAVFGDIEGSVNFVIKDEYENTTNASTTESGKVEGDNMDINLAYNWGSWTFYGMYEAKGVDFTSGGSKSETSRNTIMVGAGHTHEVSSTARIYSDVTYNMVTSEDKLAGATLAKEIKNNNLKVNLGFEVDANSWLTWRGSVRQNVLIDNTKTKAATAGALESEVNGSSTAFNAGATLNFGKLKVDGNIGTGVGAGTDSDTLNTDAILTEVAVHYWF